MSHAYLALDSDISKGFHKQTKIKCCLSAVEVGAGGVRIPLCPFFFNGLHAVSIELLQ